MAIGRVDDDKVPQVDNDQVGATAEMTRLLLRLGMRRIAYMGGCTNYTVNEDRLRGYLRGFSDCGVQVDQKLIWTGIETSEQRIDALKVRWSKARMSALRGRQHGGRGAAGAARPAHQGTGTGETGQLL